MVGVDATGLFAVAGVSTSLKDFAALAHHDYTTGFLRAETWWHWACVAGRLPDHRTLGLNVSCGTNKAAIEKMVTGWRASGLLSEALSSNSITKISNQTGEFMEQTEILSSHFPLVTVTTPMGRPQRCRVTSTSCSGILKVGSASMRKGKVVALPGFTESQYMLW